MVKFGSIEIARAFFVYTTLEEATRRGARVAAVCQVNDPAIREIAALSDGGPASDVIYGLTTANIVVEYLDTAGNALGDPIGSYGLIRYVRVRIVNYTYTGWIPFMNVVFTSPGFAATLPRESLGVPREGVVTPC